MEVAGYGEVPWADPAAGPVVAGHPTPSIAAYARGMATAARLEADAAEQRMEQAYAAAAAGDWSPDLAEAHCDSTIAWDRAAGHAADAEYYAETGGHLHAGPEPEAGW